MKDSKAILFSKFQLKRMARRLLWPRPALYLPFGILRNHGNVFRADCELYISGYPRSGNTFAVKAFLLANPGAKLRSHKHIPPYIVQSVKRNMPGMVLIRNPLDAAISWAIYMKMHLLETLVYFNDFYQVLLPHRAQLFFVSFDAVIDDFGEVMTAFNARWGTNYTPFQHTPENAARCWAAIEAEYVHTDGSVDELRVARPSAQRQSQKEMFLRELDNSSVLQEQLRRATGLYHRCVGAPGASLVVPREVCSRRQDAVNPVVCRLSR